VSAPGQSSEPASHRRATGWIVASCVLAVALVGMFIWALNAQSDADDAQAALAAREKAATAASPEPTATAASPEPTATASATAPAVDAATQQELEQVTNDLGATSDSVEQIEQDLDQAAATVEDAEKARDNAKGALDTAKAEADALKAHVELTQTCLRGTLDALKSSLESGGPEAAVQELQKLAGNCASAASP
jgi:chromosome segregation ATPase